MVYKRKHNQPPARRRANAGQRAPLTTEERWRIVSLSTDAGWSIHRISEHIGRDRTVIRRCLRRHAETNDVVDRPRSGRPSVTNQREDRTIVNQARQDPFVSSMEILNHMRYNLRLNLSDQTIRNRLAEAGLRNFRPATFPMLHDAHKQARLDWANAHSGWGLNEWRTVLFTDESRFTVRFSDGRIGVWRLSRERFQARFVRQVDRYGGAALWCGQEYATRGKRHFISCTIA